MKTETSVQFTSSRQVLTGSGSRGAGSVHAETESARAVVESSPGLFSALIAAAGDLRRVDLWSDGDSLVIHGYAEDSNAPTSGSLHRGRAAAAMALAQLLTPSHMVTADPDEAAPVTPSEFANLGAVIRFATEKESGVRMCALNPNPNDPAAEVTVVLFTDSFQWGTAKGGQPIEFSPQLVAALWSRVLCLLGLADHAPVGAG